MSNQNDNIVEDNKIIKRPLRIKRTKDQIYVKEQQAIFVKLCGILEIAEKQNYFIETIVDDKENEIKALVEDIKKFYPSSVWHRSSGEVKTITIAKQIFTHHGYEISSKNITVKKNEDKVRVKKYLLTKNE